MQCNRLNLKVFENLKNVCVQWRNIIIITIKTRWLLRWKYFEGQSKVKCSRVHWTNRFIYESAVVYPINKILKAIELQLSKKSEIAIEWEPLIESNLNYIRLQNAYSNFFVQNIIKELKEFQRKERNQRVRERERMKNHPKKRERKKEMKKKLRR